MGDLILTISADVARMRKALLRSNPCYRPHFAIDRRGVLIVTRRFIFATGTYAVCWR